MIFLKIASPSSSPPTTPRTQRVKDMVGEDNIDNLPLLLNKIKTVMHCIPKSQMVQQSMISSLAEDYKESQPDFMGVRADFANAMTLIDLCPKVASQSPQSSSSTPNLASINQKLEKILVSQATILANTQNIRVATPSPPSFADIAKRGVKTTSGPKVAQSKPPTTLPPKILS